MKNKNIELDDEGNPSRNIKVLRKFVEFCLLHSELRFWQSLFAFTKKDITVGGEDPFFWEGIDK